MTNEEAEANIHALSARMTALDVRMAQIEAGLLILRPMRAAISALEKENAQIWKYMVMDMVKQTNATLADLRRMLGDIPAEPGPALGEPVGAEQP